MPDASSRDTASGVQVLHEGVSRGDGEEVRRTIDWQWGRGETGRA